MELTNTNNTELPQRQVSALINGVPQGPHINFIRLAADAMTVKSSKPAGYTSNGVDKIACPTCGNERKKYCKTGTAPPMPRGTQHMSAKSG